MERGGNVKFPRKTPVGFQVVSGESVPNVSVQTALCFSVVFHVPREADGHEVCLRPPNRVRD